MSAMENLSDALQAHIIPNQEYLLQGSILDTAVEHLLHRLRGLCDNVDTGPEQFHDHEICLSLRAPASVIADISIGNSAIILNFRFSEPIAAARP